MGITTKTKVAKRQLLPSFPFGNEVFPNKAFPKDAIYHLDNFSCLYNEKLENFQDKNDIFSKLYAFYQASTEILAISDGYEATELMKMSNSIQGRE